MFKNLNLVYTESISPLDQFEIRDLFNINSSLLGYINISLTNIGLYLVLSFIIIIILNLIATNYNKIINNK